MRILLTDTQYYILDIVEKLLIELMEDDCVVGEELGCKVGEVLKLIVSETQKNELIHNLETRYRNETCYASYAFLIDKIHKTGHSSQYL